MNPKSSSNSGNSNRLSTSLFVAGASLPITVFLFEATPILILTVDPAFLGFITQLVLFLISAGILAFIVIGIKWFWHVVDDDIHNRHYWREQRTLDLEKLRLEVEARKQPTRPLATRMNRSTDASIPVVMQQQRPVTRRLNSYRPDH